MGAGAKRYDMMFNPNEEIPLMPTEKLVAFYVEVCDAINCTEPGALGGIALDDLKRKTLAELDARRKQPATVPTPMLVEEIRRKRGRPKKVQF